MRPKIRKAVLPVAGLGTRFLPATKAIPKEMLPIVDKPLIQYAVEEAINAGIDEIILVTRQDKGAIESHFQRGEALEQELLAKGKANLMQSLDPVMNRDIKWRSVFQPVPLGLGHAVLCARELVGDEPFAVLLPDDLIFHEGRGCLHQMIEVYGEYQCGIVAVENVPRAMTGSYGIVDSGKIGAAVGRINSIVEKPDPASAPSTLAVVGRYILPPVIFELLEKTSRGSGGEIQLTDAIALLLGQAQVLAYEFEGKRYDCGSKFGFLQANVEYALEHPEIKKQFRDYLAGIK